MADLRLGPKHTALTVGLFTALMHLLWSLVVALGMGQGWVNWIISLHFMTIAITITSFNIVTALTLVAVTFIVGAIVGWIFATVFNWVGKKRF